MNERKIFIFSIIIVVSVVIFYLLTEKLKTNQVSSYSTSLKSTVSPVSEWKTYINSKHEYALQYPKDVYIQPAQEMDPFSVEESASIEMGVRGDVPSVGVRIIVWELYPYKTVDKESLSYNIEHNRVTQLDLKSFSETLRQQEVDNKNLNFPNKTVSELEEINFAGQKAYAVTISNYMDGYGSDTFRRIYLIEGNDKKIIIQYSLNSDLSKQIVDTFRFTK